MNRTAERLRVFLQGIGLRRVLAGAAALLALTLAGVWFGVLATHQEEASGQTKPGESPQSPPGTQSKASVPTPITIPVPKSLPESTQSIASATVPRGIPGLGDMDVIGSLQYLSGTDFRCDGPSPDRGLIKRVCSSPSSEDSSASYEVTLVEKNPSTVLSVQATAYDATEDEAAKFFSYVAKLSLEDTNSINIEAWVSSKISSGAGT
jgi:hypothetical protein